MITVLNAVADKVIYIDNVLYWIGAIGTIGGAIAAVVLPLRNMLKKYDNRLEENRKFIEEQTKLNEEHQELINQSKEDRQRLNDDIAIIKAATLIQIKVNINTIADRIVERGFAWSKECDNLEMLYENYRPLGGNGITAAKISKVRELPVQYGNKDTKE